MKLEIWIKKCTLKKKYNEEKSINFAKEFYKNDKVGSKILDDALKEKTIFKQENFYQ